MWFLDDAKGNTVTDSSGNGHEGKALGALNWAKGKFADGIEFAGGESVEIPFDDSLDFGDKRSFSVTTWFKFSAAQDWNRLVRGRNPGPWGGGNTGWELQTQGIQIHWSLDDKAKNNLQSTFADAGNGEWRHTAMVVNREKKTMYIYLDGGNEKTTNIANITSITSGTPIVFGGGYKGSLDDIAIFNVAITPDDVKTIMEKGLVETFKSGAAITSSSRLSTTWGDIKN